MSAQPNIQDWQSLVGNTYPGYNMGSSPNNSACKVKSDGCSKEMGSQDVCFWHKYRMGKMSSFKCACAIDHPLVNGDVTGRKLARDYYDLVYENVATIGLCSDYPYCCGKCMNADSEVFICGGLQVGYCCAHKHKADNLMRIACDDNVDDDREDSVG
jgi:hypothetical protein